MGVVDTGYGLSSPERLVVSGLPDGVISYRVRARIEDIVMIYLKFADRVEQRQAEFDDPEWFAKEDGPITIRPGEVVAINYRG